VPGAVGGTLCTEADREDPASEYLPDIFERLFRREFEGLPSSTYMESQQEITAKMRGILIDWLVSVNDKYRLKQETIFLTVSILDRYLARVQVPRKRLQLVGTVALFIAAKFEEIDPPQAEKLVYMTDNTCTQSDIFKTECQFLTVLEWKVLVPTAVQFLERFQICHRCDNFHCELSRYILELTLLDIGMLRHGPSRLAASALLLSNELLGSSPVWPAALARVSRHCMASLEDCVNDLRGQVDSAPRMSLQSIKRKYSHQRHMSVANMMPAGSGNHAL